MISLNLLSTTMLVSTILLAANPTAAAFPHVFQQRAAARHLNQKRAASTTTFDGWSAKGCVTEGTGGRLLTGYSQQGVASLTLQGCLDVCSSMAYAYAGLECASVFADEYV